eukprot:scaffold7516_cov376-Prasinococcus_capsulatus_cf.AAC.2
MGAPYHEEMGQVVDTHLLLVALGRLCGLLRHSVGLDACGRRARHVEAHAHLRSDVKTRRQLTTTRSLGLASVLPWKPEGQGRDAVEGRARLYDPVAEVAHGAQGHQVALLNCVAVRIDA